MAPAANNPLSETTLDVESIRANFPLLVAAASTGRVLCYLDNAATSQKPAAVIDAIGGCYRHYYGSVHRGLYELAEEATERYEQARKTVARFIGAPSDQLVFTRSATEAINLVATGWLAPRVQPGDAVWISRMEHHANFLPWQRTCKKAGVRLRIIELRPDGSLDLECREELYGPRTRLIALTQVSNVLGVVNPVRDIAREARRHGIPVLVDAAQSVAHMPVDVAELGCDFLALSAHKMVGPTGIGALYAKAEHLEVMEPLLVGGGMVDEVGDFESSWARYPGKFEAGSPNLAGAIGFAAAAQYLSQIGMDRIRVHVQTLTEQALNAMRHIPGLTIYGPTEASGRAGILAFNLAGIHAHDVAQLVAERGVAIRAGHHCCQPLMGHLGVAATVRASFALYNRPEDVEALIEALEWTRQVLQ